MNIYGGWYTSRLTLCYILSADEVIFGSLQRITVMYEKEPTALERIEFESKARKCFDRVYKKRSNLIGRWHDDFCKSHKYQEVKYFLKKKLEKVFVFLEMNFGFAPKCFVDMLK